MSTTQNASQQTLTRKGREKIITSIKKLVAERHINVSNPNQDYGPWLALVDQRTPHLLAVDTPSFEAGMSEILKELGSHKNGKVLVGFAAETENHVKNGLEKLKAKNLDLIVINPVSGPDSAFDSDMNHATIIDASGHTEEIPLVSKHVLADKILDRVAQLLK